MRRSSTNSTCPKAVAVGIDVAKATLSVCCRSEDGTETALSIGNTEADIRRAMRERLSGFSGRIVMESTGHYHWRAALILSEAGHDVRVVNPILSKQYITGSVRKVKTDKADAAALARMAATSIGLPAPFTLTRKMLNVRKKLSTLAGISHHLRAMEASFRGLAEARDITGSTMTPGERAIAVVVRALKTEMKKLQREVETEVRAAQEDDDAFALLESIPGVSSFCAALALHWFALLPDATPKSWVGFAGLDVSSRESGTWRGRCRLTKRGNSFLRQRLFAAAWGAVMHDHRFQEYYAHLRSQGRTYVEALVIIARKIVRTMFMVLTTRHAYDPARFHFAEVLSTEKN